MQELQEGHEGDASFEDLAVSVVRGALPRRRLQDVVDAEDHLSGLGGGEEQWSTCRFTWRLSVITTCRGRLWGETRLEGERKQ